MAAWGEVMRRPPFAHALAGARAGAARGVQPAGSGTQPGGPILELRRVAKRFGAT